MHIKSLALVPWEDYLHSRLLDTRVLAVSGETQAFSLHSTGSSGGLQGETPGARHLQYVAGAEELMASMARRPCRQTRRRCATGPQRSLKRSSITSQGLRATG